MKKAWLIGLLLWGAIPAVWPAPAGSVKAKDLYQEALDSYLSGNYDKAVLLDTQALQADPQDRKASELLNILVYEMKWAHQTDIWIGAQDSPLSPKIPAATAPPPPGKPSLRKTFKAGPAALSQLAAQIQVMNLLMARNAEEQAKMLKLAQGNEDGKWRDLSQRVAWLEGQSPTDELVPMRILCLLALLVAFIALVSSLKTQKELKQYKAYFLSRVPESEKIVPFTKFGRWS